MSDTIRLNPDALAENAHIMRLLGDELDLLSGLLRRARLRAEWAGVPSLPDGWQEAERGMATLAERTQSLAHALDRVAQEVDACESAIAWGMGARAMWRWR